MRKRFVVALDFTTPEQNRQFKDRLIAMGFASYWWHWLRDCWLIVDVTGTTSASNMIDIVNEIYPGTNSLVLELPEGCGDTWVGYGPAAEGRNMFVWLHKNWK